MNLIDHRSYTHNLSSCEIKIYIRDHILELRRKL